MRAAKLASRSYTRTRAPQRCIAAAAASPPSPAPTIATSGRAGASKSASKSADAAEQVREAIYGEVVARVNEGVRQYDLVVRLDPSQRETIEQVRNLLLHGRGGAIGRLRDVADIGPERSSNLIMRENALR